MNKTSNLLLCTEAVRTEHEGKVYYVNIFETVNPVTRTSEQGHEYACTISARSRIHNSDTKAKAEARVGHTFVGDIYQETVEPYVINGKTYNKRAKVRFEEYGTSYTAEGVTENIVPAENKGKK